MVGVRKRGVAVRQFILDNIEKHPIDLAKCVGVAFGVSRQAVNQHIRQLVDQNLIEVSGSTRNPCYRLKSEVISHHVHSLDGKQEEDQVGAPI